MKRLTMILCAASLAACAVEPTETVAETGTETRHDLCRPLALRGDLSWYGTNRQTLTSWLDSRGCASAGFDPDHRPVAMLDWDNTISKNDFGDAVTFHLVSHDLVKQPPGYDWKHTSRYMTDAGAAALHDACGTAVPPGHSLPTSTNAGCADEILSMYIDGVTRSGAAAFAGWNHRRMEPTYAWTAQLFGGYTHDQVKLITLSAVLPQLVAPEGATQTIGTHTGLNAWLRIYDQQRSLIAALQSRGYNVWIITASPQDVIAAVAPLSGIPASRVVGIRQLTDHGRLTYRIEGCGPVADGEDGMITYVEGKRCWVNKVVFGDDSVHAIERRPADDRQVFAAGDSDTDIEFVRDAAFKFVLNRNKGDLMCHAYFNEGDSWRVNPMFIEPKAAKSSPYACSTTACVDESGAGVPCRDEEGNVIPDQLDTVHP